MLDPNQANVSVVNPCHAGLPPTISLAKFQNLISCKSTAEVRTASLHQVPVCFACLLGAVAICFGSCVEVQ